MSCVFPDICSRIMLQSGVEDPHPNQIMVKLKIHLSDTPLFYSVCDRMVLMTACILLEEPKFKGSIGFSLFIIKYM